MDNNIEKARRGFEASFQEAQFYNRQTQDQEHLEQILGTMELQAGEQVLDLGTGNGYLAFAMAKSCPKAVVTGLDIVAKTLENNRREAEHQGIKNLTFTVYDGGRFPFEADSFGGIVTRYALHHFPALPDSFHEMARVLKKGGRLLISDPIPEQEDAGRFVDRYMQLKDDGHNRFYTRDEFIAMAEAAGLQYISEFDASIRFPRKMELSYTRLLDQTEERIKQLYDLQVVGNECYITEKVLNLVFKKRK